MTTWRDFWKPWGWALHALLACALTVGLVAVKTDPWLCPPVLQLLGYVREVLQGTRRVPRWDWSLGSTVEDRDGRAYLVVYLHAWNEALGWGWGSLLGVALCALLGLGGQ
jgi:hypothetical protein